MVPHNGHPLALKALFQGVQGASISPPTLRPCLGWVSFVPVRLELADLVGEVGHLRRPVVIRLHRGAVGIPTTMERRAPPASSARLYEWRHHAADGGGVRGRRSKPENLHVAVLQRLGGTVFPGVPQVSQ